MKKDEIIKKCAGCGTDIIVHKSRAYQPALCISCEIKANRESK